MQRVGDLCNSKKFGENSSLASLQSWFFRLNKKHKTNKLGIIMAKNEKSSSNMASLAGKVLQKKSSTKTAKSLAASVLTQAPDKKK
jgi:hypothetical protein